MLKRLENVHERERKRRRNQMIMGTILVAVMIVSTAGYAIIDRAKEQAVSYKGNKFLRTERGWQLHNSALVTRFLPGEVDFIPCNCASSASELADKQIYIDAYSTDEKIAADELLRNIQFLRVQQACLVGEENKTGCEELPLKSCDEDNIIIVRSTENITEVREEGRCIFIEAAPENLTMAADRFIFFLYKLI